MLSSEPYFCLPYADCESELTGCFRSPVSNFLNSTDWMCNHQPKISIAQVTLQYCSSFPVVVGRILYIHASTKPDGDTLCSMIKNITKDDIGASTQPYSFNWVNAIQNVYKTIMREFVSTVCRRYNWQFLYVKMLIWLPDQLLIYDGNTSTTEVCVPHTPI